MAHTHGKKIKEKRVKFVILLNFIITVAEVFGGLLSGSLALISDALHNFSDTIAIFISYIAYLLGKKEVTYKKTYGYKRAEILAALFNSTVLIVISFFLFKEAVVRLKSPTYIKGWLMLSVAIIGLVANLLSVLLLREDSKKSLNLKSAYMHLFMDTLSSVAVVLGGIAIVTLKVYWIDPLLTFIIALYVLKESFSILRESMDILMEATPPGIDILDIKKEVEKIPEVKNLHHVHLWQIGDNDIHFEAHIEVDPGLKLEEVDKIRIAIDKLLKEMFGIHHVTLQMESDSCQSKSILGNGEQCP